MIADGAFHKHVKLEEAELCDGLQEIGPQALCNCKALKEITIPPSVTATCDHAFMGCNILTKVDLSNGLLEIGDNAFTKYSSVRHQSQKPNVDKHWRVRTSQRKTAGDNFGRYLEYSMNIIVVPDETKRIGLHTFSNCTFSNLRIPPLIKITSYGMLSECERMFSLEMP